MTAPTPPVRVQALDHVTLIVHDLERSRQFYVDLLGMQEVPRPDFSFAGKWFQAGATQIHLILEHEQSGPAGAGGENASTRSHHFAFTIEDAHAAATHLREQGLSLVSGPKERPDGALQVFLTDPDGHLVELCQPIS